MFGVLLREGRVWASMPFVGRALAVTALPVLAPILRDRGLARAPLAWTLRGIVSISTGGPPSVVPPRF